MSEVKQNRLKVAGRELLKGNFGLAVKSLTAPMPVQPGNYRGFGSWLFGANGGRDIHFSFSDAFSSLKAFEECAPLNSIITKKTKAYLNGKTWVLDKNGKEVNTEPAKRIRKLLTQPNPLQSWAEFEAQGKIYRELFGYNIIYTIKPIGFDNSYAKSIWNLPPQFVDIEEETNVRPFDVKDKNDLIRKITFCTPDGQRSVLPKELITIHKNASPVIDSYILPSNPIKPLQPQINNIIGGLESRGALIDYRGALGMITPDSGSGGLEGLPFTSQQKEEIQKDFLSYGLKRGQFKFIISPAAAKWQQMGIPTKELMLFEEIMDDIARICDAKDFPFELISSEKGTTFANKNEANKALYQNTIIPESSHDYQQWIMYFNAEFYGLKIDKDFSHIPVLQEDKRNSAMARRDLGGELEREFKNNWITLNRVLELLDEDGIGSDGDKYYRELLAMGWVFGTQTNNNEGQGQQTGSGGNQGNQTDQGQTN